MRSSKVLRGTSNNLQKNRYQIRTGSEKRDGIGTFYTEAVILSNNNINFFLNKKSDY